GIAAKSQTQTIFKINDDENEIILYLKDLPVLIDSTNSLSFNTVTSDSYLPKFAINRSYQNKDFDEHSTYWVQIPIQQTSSNSIWLMEFFDQTIDELTIFKPESNGSFVLVEQGDHRNFLNRENLHKNFTVRLNDVNDTVQVYYARIRSHEFADIRIA